MIFIVHVIDVAMMLDNASALHEFIKPRPSSSPRCATLPRPNIVAEDAHHTTSGLH
jgi:hypothetical protein